MRMTEESSRPVVLERALQGATGSSVNGSKSVTESEGDGSAFDLSYDPVLTLAVVSPPLPASLAHSPAVTLAVNPTFVLLPLVQLSRALPIHP